jgi:hypothetical protein
MRHWGSATSTQPCEWSASIQTASTDPAIRLFDGGHAADFRLSEDPEGLLEIIDGVTRATRIAKLDAQQLVPVVIIGRYHRSRAGSATVKDRL